MEYCISSSYCAIVRVSVVMKRTVVGKCIVEILLETAVSTQGTHTSSVSVYVRINHHKLTSSNDYVKLKIKVNLPQLCNVVSAAQKWPTLSDLVGFELTVYTIRYITSTQNPLNRLKLAILSHRNDVA